jgi:hypothetical protein
MNGGPGEELSRGLVVKIGELSWILNFPENQYLDKIANLSKKCKRFGVCTTAHYSTSCVSVYDPPLSDVNGHLKNGI